MFRGLPIELLEGGHFLQQAVQQTRGPSGLHTEFIVSHLTSLLCPEHMKFKNKIVEASDVVQKKLFSSSKNKNKKEEEKAEQQQEQENSSSSSKTQKGELLLLIQVGNFCRQLVLENPKAYQEAEMSTIDILPEIYGSLSVAFAEIENLDNKNNNNNSLSQLLLVPSNAKQISSSVLSAENNNNNNHQQLRSAFISAMKILLLVGPTEDQRALPGSNMHHIKADFFRNLSRFAGVAQFFDPECLYYALAVSAAEEGAIPVHRLIGGNDINEIPSHLLGSVVSSGLVPWPSALDMLEISNLQQQEEQEAKTTIFTSEAISSLEELISSIITSTTTSSSQNDENEKEENEEKLSLLSRMQLNHARMLLNFGKLSPSDSKAQNDANFLFRCRLSSLLLVDKNAEKETNSSSSGGATGNTSSSVFSTTLLPTSSFYRQLGPIIKEFSSKYVKESFAIDLVECWRRLADIYHASHQGVKPLDILLEDLASTLSSSSSSNNKNNAENNNEDAADISSPSATSSSSPTSSSNQKEQQNQNQQQEEKETEQEVTTTYESKFTKLRIFQAAIYHASAQITGKANPHGGLLRQAQQEARNAGAQTALVQRVLRIMTSSPSLVTCKIVRAFASLCGVDDHHHGLRFNDNASRLVRALDAGLITSLCDCVKTLMGNVTDIDSMNARDLAPALSCFALLAMSVAQSQNASANPAQFLLEDSVLPKTLLRMLTVPDLSLKNCSPKRASCFIQACSAATVFVNHNIRDMVPALTERGFLRAVFDSLKSIDKNISDSLTSTSTSDENNNNNDNGNNNNNNNGNNNNNNNNFVISPENNFHWCVPHCIPMINAFAVHNSVKEFLICNIDTLLNMLKVLNHHNVIRNDVKWANDFFEMIRTLPSLRDRSCKLLVEMLNDIGDTGVKLSRNNNNNNNSNNNNVTSTSAAAATIIDSASIRSATSATSSNNNNNVQEEEQKEFNDKFALPFFGYCSFMSGAISSINAHDPNNQQQQQQHMFGGGPRHHRNHGPPQEIVSFTKQNIGEKIRKCLKSLLETPGAMLFHEVAKKQNDASSNSNKNNIFNVDNNNNNKKSLLFQTRHPVEIINPRRLALQHQRPFHADVAQVLRSLEPSEFGVAWNSIAVRVQNSIATVRRNLPKQHPFLDSSSSAFASSSSNSDQQQNQNQNQQNVNEDSSSQTSTSTKKKNDDNNDNDDEKETVIPPQENKWLLFVLELCLSLREGNARGAIDNCTQARERAMQQLIDLFFEINAAISSPILPPNSSQQQQQGQQQGNKNIQQQHDGNILFLDRVSTLLAPEAPQEFTPARGMGGLGGGDMLEFLQLRANRGMGTEVALQSLRVIFDQLPRLIVDNQSKLRQAQFCIRTVLNILNTNNSQAGGGGGGGGPPSFLLNDDSLTRALDALIDLDEKVNIRHLDVFKDILGSGFEIVRTLSNFSRFTRNDRRKTAGRLVVKFFTCLHRDEYIERCENLDRWVLELFANLTKEMTSFDNVVVPFGATEQPAFSSSSATSGGVHGPSPSYFNKRPNETPSTTRLSHVLGASATSGSSGGGGGGDNTSSGRSLVIDGADSSSGTTSPRDHLQLAFGPGGARNLFGSGGSNRPGVAHTPTGTSAGSSSNITNQNQNTSNNISGTSPILAHPGQSPLSSSSGGARHHRTSSNQNNNTGGGGFVLSGPIAELVAEGWSELQASTALEEASFDLDEARQWLALNADVINASDVSTQRRRQPVVQAPTLTPGAYVKQHTVLWMLSMLRVGREKIWRKLEKQQEKENKEKENNNNNSDSYTVWEQELSRLHAPACKAIYTITRHLQDRAIFIQQLVEALIENPFKNLDAVQQITSLFAQANSLSLRMAISKETMLVKILVHQ